MIRRRRVKHTLNFAERLMNEAERLRTFADTLPSGNRQDELLAKAAQMDSARELDDMLRLGGGRAFA